MELQIAVAKTNKFGSSDSGDTFEIVERPIGGMSFVLADGQSGGSGSKAISMMVVRKVISLLADGVRDGTAARAASDALFTEKNGKAAATLNILSVDLLSKTIVLSRNSECPIYIAGEESLECLNEKSEPIGLSRNTKPIITEIPIRNGITILLFTDGVLHAGNNTGQQIDIATTITGLFDESDPSPQELADALLAQAVRLDQNRPVDDISVVALKVCPNQTDDIRRMNIRIPFDLASI
jgi:serine phosphatase RsbU (regulator of sigma subunit)